MPCYTDAFESELYWRGETDAELASCEEVVELKIGRTISPPSSNLVRATGDQPQSPACNADADLFADAHGRRSTQSPI